MSHRIGITERGDAGIHFEWIEELDLMAMGILITKNVNDRFIKEVLQRKDKIIVHATVTGMGGTIYEPNVPTLEKSYEQIKKLILMGMPKEQIVLRLDPIIPTNNGIKTAEKVLEIFKDLGIKRCRISIMDMYPHVKRRFENANVDIPYEGFQAPYEMISNVKKMLQKYGNIYTFETCAENIVPEWKKACVSKTDSDILGKDIMFYRSKNQRTGCLCPMNKSEMLNHTHRCPHQCLYCYWVD